MKKISLPLCLFVTALFLESSAQDSSRTVRKPRELNRTFQFSLFPGISTNGLHSGFYQNDFSFNVFGGISAGNRIFELGLVTNVELNSVTGIQIAGLANIIGANTFLNLSLSEQRALEHAGFESNQQGIQLAGFLNYVRINGKGIQLAGGFNAVGFNFNGVQLAGLGNLAGGQAVGFQIAGLFNMASEDMGGVQISSILNSTNGQLAGVQLAMINKSVRMKGKNSSPRDYTTGVQIGLLNFSREMDGTQIGLINFGGEMRGRQIGLINFFKRYPPKEYVMNGTPIGLLNFGSMGTYVRVSANELFPLNAELSTGNCANCSSVSSNMPYEDNWKKYNSNVLIAGYDKNENTWGFGYGFQRVLFNKFVITPKNKFEAKMNERYMMSFGLKFIHLNREMKFDKVFNLVSRANFEYGIRFRRSHLFGGVSLNYFLQEADEPREVYAVRSVRVATGTLFGLNASFWPGYTVGLHF